MSDFNYDSTGIDPDKKASRLVPQAWHEWKIVTASPKRSKNGDPMVKASCEIINNPELNGKQLDHYVTFLPKTKPNGSVNNAAGIAVHFLKVIDQPWEGQFEVTASDWVGCTFRGRTDDEPFVSKKDGKEYKSSKIVEVDYIKEAVKESEIPF